MLRCIIIFFYQHLCVRGSTEIVKRWVNETQEAVSSDNMMVQYHAMGLLYHIRKRDRLAVSKMVTKQIRSSLRSPHGYCLLIRIACKILENEERTSNSMLCDFLETCLRHKSEVGSVLHTQCTCSLSCGVCCVACVDGVLPNKRNLSQGG